MLLRTLLLISIVVIHSNCFALEQMSDSDMKKSTARMAVAGVTKKVADDIGPLIAPAAGAKPMVDEVQPWVEYVIDAVKKKETADPIVLLMDTTNRAMQPFGLFF